MILDVGYYVNTKILNIDPKRVNWLILSLINLIIHYLLVTKIMLERQYLLTNNKLTINLTSVYLMNYDAADI